jgi:signal transduction histidine kinase
MSSTAQRDERVLVLAPTGDDAALAAGILERHEIGASIVPDLTTLAEELERGAGAALIASEGLSGVAPEALQALRDALERQESWSEFPVLLFGGDAREAAANGTQLLGNRAHVILLERPLGIDTFVSAVDAALRSRRRQYEVKRLLDQLAESALAVTRAHEEANRAKDEFLATLAHELRSPMTAIRGWIQLLRAGDLDPSEAETALSMIETSTKVQSQIIEDLMDVSRIIAGKVMIEPAHIDLRPVVESVAATFRPSAALKGVRLTTSVGAEPLMVWADAARLQQIGWNLVTNAIKFTPRGGTIAVSVAREQHRAVLRVRDNGEGINPELLPHMFERYRQGAETLTRKSHGGLGLGLAIVQHLVESHGGTIEAFSEGPGKGAELVVSLPLTDAVTDAAVPDTAAT